MTFIMVVPNGARRTTEDHPAIPVIDEDLIETAEARYDAGARGHTTSVLKTNTSSGRRTV